MRYLSFDIECCDGRNICEFGYAVTDVNFNLIEKQVFIINPEERFNLTGRQNQDDLKLFFSEEEYYSGKKFPHYYKRIKDLLTYKEQIIIGHAVSNDARFLRNACRRYKLDPIDFSFFDSQKVYSEYSNIKGQISLETAGEVFNLKKPGFLHKSDDDALLTIQMMQKMCESLTVSLIELKELCPKANGKSRNFNIMYTGDSLPEMLEALSKNINSLSNRRKECCLQQFVKKVEAQGKIIKSELTECKLCFSPSFEKNNIKDTFVLIQLLANNGCRYNYKVSENNYYVATQEELDLTKINEHSRYYSALCHKETGCKIISFDDLFNLLSVTEDELKNMPWPKRKKHKQKLNGCSSGQSTYSIGEQLKAKGIDLQKLFQNDIHRKSF